MTKDDRDVSDKPKWISGAFERGHGNVDSEGLTDALRANGELSPDETVLEVKGHYEKEFFKYGIYESDNGPEYYALACKLDPEGFDNEYEMEAVRKQVQSGDIEIHDLSMDELEIGLLYKFDLEEGKWELKQEDHNVTSRQDFIFVTESEFLDRILYDDKIEHDATKPEGNEL